MLDYFYSPAYKTFSADFREFIGMKPNLQLDIPMDAIYCVFGLPKPLKKPKIVTSSTTYVKSNTSNFLKQGVMYKELIH